MLWDQCWNIVAIWEVNIIVRPVIMEAIVGVMDTTFCDQSGERRTSDPALPTVIVAPCL
jgi:hypothetical protein